MQIALILSCILVGFMLLNAFLFFAYTNGSTDEKYTNPKDEFYIYTIKPSFSNIVVWPLLHDIWYCRKIAPITMGAFGIENTPTRIEIYRNNHSGLFSLKSGKVKRHNLNYEELVEVIEKLFQDEQTVKLKLRNIINLLEIDNKEHFKDRILKREVSNLHFQTNDSFNHDS